MKSLKSSQYGFKLFRGVERRSRSICAGVLLLQQPSNLAVSFLDIAPDGLQQSRPRPGLSQIKTQFLDHHGVCLLHRPVHCCYDCCQLLGAAKGEVADGAACLPCLLQEHKYPGACFSIRYKRTLSARREDLKSTNSAELSPSTKLLCTLTNCLFVRDTVM